MAKPKSDLIKQILNQGDIDADENYDDLIELLIDEPLSINVTQGNTITIEDYNAFDSDGEPYSISKYFDNLNWVYLYDNNNTITVTGSADVTITARFFKNVGV